MEIKGLCVVEAPCASFSWASSRAPFCEDLPPGLGMEGSCAPGRSLCAALRDGRTSARGTS